MNLKKKKKKKFIQSPACQGFRFLFLSPNRVTPLKKKMV